jgi:hypothetical protein
MKVGAQGKHRPRRRLILKSNVNRLYAASRLPELWILSAAMPILQPRWRLRHPMFAETRPTRAGVESQTARARRQRQADRGRRETVASGVQMRLPFSLRVRLSRGQWAHALGDTQTCLQRCFYSMGNGREGQRGQKASSSSQGISQLQGEPSPDAKDGGCGTA